MIVVLAQIWAGTLVAASSGWLSKKHTSEKEKPKSQFSKIVSISNISIPVLWNEKEWTSLLTAACGSGMTGRALAGSWHRKWQGVLVAEPHGQRAPTEVLEGLHDKFILYFYWAGDMEVVCIDADYMVGDGT